jgi:hypothetical protein
MTARISIIILLSGTALCPAADNGFERELLPLLENHCFNCHDEDTQKGGLALHTLNPDVVNGGDEAVWAVVLDQLNSGEMPPKKKKRPPEKRLLTALNWLTEELDKAEVAANACGSRIVMRRLNRLEYRNTMRDLFGHPFDPTELFSPDTVSDGFDNIGHALVVSPLHVESFVAATERILDKIIDIPEKPPLRQHWRIVNSIVGQKPLKFDRGGAWHDGHVGKDKNKIKAGFLKDNVLPNIEIPNGSTPYSMIDLTQDPPRAYDGSWDIRAFGGSGVDEGVAFSKKDNTFGFKWFAYEEGVYRVRLHVQAFGPKDWQGASPKLGLTLFPEGTMWREELLKLNHSQVIEFELYRDNIPWYVKTTGNRNWGLKYYFQVSEEADADSKKVPLGIHISEIEVEGPLNPVWPPTWHSRLFPEQKNAESGEAYAARVLRPFMNRAYRRLSTDDELSEMMRIYRQEKAKGLPVKQALRMPLATILTSPMFLFIADQHELTPTPTSKAQKQVSAFELASRLSYFLWRSMPDAALFAKAEAGVLLRPEVLNSEIDRMLKDPKSEALITHFTHQWLSLGKLRNLTVDTTLHPDYDLALHQSMIGESTAFFGEILHKKLSLYTFLDSDFLMLDERLARHYGIPGIRGNAFRKVKLKETDLRGGLLTQAAILTATSNGIRTKPITRGAFVLENILADPPNPPPPDVPAVEDLVVIEPAATLRKRLEQHRNNPSCLNCHKKIDPIGFALENYDAIGKWRAHEMVAADATIHKPAPFQPGQTITIRFANGSGANTDFIAILPAGVKDDESYKKPGLYDGSPIWKHTTNTKKRAANGIFSGVISLTAPVQPGEYEARFYFAGNNKIPRARQTFTVTKTPLKQHAGAGRPPLLLDPAEGEKTLVSVPVDPAGKLPDGRAFKGIDDFKKLLLEDKDAFLKCLTEKMLVYALGRPVVFGDRTLVRNIVGDLKQQPTLDTLIKAIITSDAFHNKDQGAEK